MTDTPLVAKLDKLARVQHTNMLLCYNLALLDAKTVEERHELFMVFVNAGCMAISTAISSTGDKRDIVLDDLIDTLPQVLRDQIDIILKNPGIPLAEVRRTQ